MFYFFFSFPLFDYNPRFFDFGFLFVFIFDPPTNMSRERRSGEKGFWPPSWPCVFVVSVS